MTPAGRRRDAFDHDAAARPAAARVAVREREAAVHARCRQGEQAVRRQRPRGAAASGRQPRAPAVQERGRRRGRQARRRRGDVAGARAGGGGTAGRRPRAGSRRARSISAARAGARWCRAARPRGCRSTCSCRRARTWRVATARQRRAARCWRRSPSTASPRAPCTRATSARPGRTRWSISAPPAGQAARIDLIARGTKGDLAWGEPRIVVKAPRRRRPRTPQPKFDHIFVWMVDTLRADKLHAYNAKTRVTTPNYDAFAADATRFEWAQVPGTWSLPSHASLLTGVYPTVHRATAHEARLSKDVPFVAEELKKAGFKTAMFSSNGYISSKWGFDRGWDVNRNFIRESLPNGSEYLWKTAKAWLTPDRAPSGSSRISRPSSRTSPTRRARSSWSSTGTRPTSGRSSRCCRACSSGSSRAASSRSTTTTRSTWRRCTTPRSPQSDAAFATFIADLKAMGIYDKSAVIVVSDHGDQFYEHGSVGHGDTVYQELVHVPLIIRAPGVFPAGPSCSADVEVMDVYATLLDLAGLKPGATVEGTSLVALARDEVGAQPARRADRRRPGGARPEGAALPHGAPRPSAHRALRRAGRSARTEGRRRRAADRDALDARRAGPALRLRDHVVEGELGHGRQRFPPAASSTPTSR